LETIEQKLSRRVNIVALKALNPITDFLHCSMNEFLIVHDRFAAVECDHCLNYILIGN